MSATALKPTECTFQNCVSCVDLPYVFFAGGLKTRTAVARLH